MAKSDPMTWHVLLDENEWADEGEDGLPEVAIGPSNHRRGRAGALGFSSLLLLAFLWWWMGGPFAPSQAEAGVAAAVAIEAEHPAVVGSIVPAAPRTILADDLRNGAHPSEQISIQQSRFLGSQAMVQVRVVDGTLPLPYREVRFYEQVGDTWQRIPPIDAFWGREQMLTSEFFELHYRQRDGLAVEAATPVLDKAYSDLRRVFGLPAPGADHKIRVDVETAEGFHGMNDRQRGRMQLRSPLLFTAPESLSDGGVLAQSALFILTDWTIIEALRIQRGDGSLSISLPMLNALRLWSQWEVGSALAPWRRSLVRGILVADTETASDLISACQFYGGWNGLTSGINFTVPCVTSGNADESKTVRTELGLRNLPQLWEKESASFADSATDQRVSSVALATLLDYATHTYGRGRLPLLLHAPAVYGSWKSLIPAVFDVTAETFEAGWRKWLATEYGVDAGTN